MSTFDNPFDPNRRLHAGGCSCGQHLSEAEHQAAQLQIQSAIAERAKTLRRRGRLRRDARDVSAGRRAARVPEIGGRGDGGRGACRSSSRSRPRPKCSRKAGRSRRRTSRSASSRSPAPRRSSWRRRWGSMPRTASTSKSSRPPAGRSFATRPSTRNTTRRTCCRRCRSPSPWASAPIRFPTPCRRSRTSTARRSRLRSSTRTSATRRTGRVSSSPCPSTTRCTITCCATISPSTASIPIPTCRSARCRRRKWSPICAPTTSTASSGPIR